MSLSAGLLRVHVVASGGDVIIYTENKLDNGHWYKVEVGIESTALSLIGRLLIDYEAKCYHIHNANMEDTTCYKLYTRKKNATKLSVELKLLGNRCIML